MSSKTVVIWDHRGVVGARRDQGQGHLEGIELGAQVMSAMRR